MRATILAALLVSILAGAAHASPQQPSALRWVTWTNPTANVLLIPGVDLDTGDSILIPDCHANGEPLRDLARVKIWQWRNTPGARPFVYAELNAVGREGLVDSAQVPDDGAHYYVAAVDTAGNESCPSNVIYFGPTTDAPVCEPEDQVVEMRIFDVHGRRVSSRVASGIYFYKARWRSGRVTSGKLPPILR